VATVVNKKKHKLMYGVFLMRKGEAEEKNKKCVCNRGALVDSKDEECHTNGTL
jgi:hypothetical protein